MIHDGARTRKRGRLLIMNRLFIVLSLLSAPSWADGYRGTGKNFGEGWQRDSQGNLHGTGKNLGRVGLPMVTVDTEGQVRISARTGPQMDEVDSRVPARTSAEGGNEILKATFMEQVRTLGGGFKRLPRQPSRNWRGFRGRLAVR